MKPAFFDLERLRKKAAREAKGSTITWLKSWWTDKYQRPANHPLFTGRSLGSLMYEMLLDYHKKRSELVEQTRHAKGMDLGKIQDAINAITAFLGDAKDPDTAFETTDPVVAAWEAAIERGENPDWDLTPVAARRKIRNGE